MYSTFVADTSNYKASDLFYSTSRTKKRIMDWHLSWHLSTTVCRIVRPSNIGLSNLGEYTNEYLAMQYRAHDRQMVRDKQRKQPLNTLKTLQIAEHQEATGGVNI